MKNSKASEPSRRWGWVVKLMSAVSAVAVIGCASPGTYSSAQRDGAPAQDLVTGGNRSGDHAVTRDSIDAILNNPDRSGGKPRPKAAEERPGLATGYGSSVKSEWRKESFVRAKSSPAGTDVVYYNDKEGIEAMAGYKSKVGGTRLVAGGLVEWGLKGGFGYLPTYEQRYMSSRRFVRGEPGGSYSITVKNRCKSRLEVVLSVDGLDVIDGKPASFAKRGYVIAPGETLEIKGWRTGPDTVARFNFTSVAGSYANLRHGDHRNVGVIGMAVFGEQGVDPWKWMPQEVNSRFEASPF